MPKITTLATSERSNPRPSRESWWIRALFRCKRITVHTGEPHEQEIGHRPCMPD